MSLIGGAIAQVFFQRASEAYHDGSLAQLAETVFGVLLTLSMFPLLLIAVVGEDLFLVIFGGSWGEAGVYAQILSIWAIFWFISSPLSTLLSVREKLTLGLNMTILNFSSRLFSLIIGGVMGSVLVAIALFSVSGAITYGLACFIFLKLAGVSPANTIKIIIRRFWLAAIFVMPIVAVQYYVSSPSIVVLSAVLIFLGYYIFIYFKDPQIISLIRNFKEK